MMLRKKCEEISAKLPIIKSESENSFILSMMSNQKSWVWLGMTRKQSKMVWLDDAPADPSNGALYSAWKAAEPSNNGNENGAYLSFHDKAWNDNKCNYGNDPSPRPMSLVKGSTRGMGHHKSLDKKKRIAIK